MDFSDQQIDDTWNAILVGFVPERIRLIEKVKQHYRVHLLSNTSDIHYNRFHEEFRTQFGYKGFEELFTNVWVSFKMGMRKPSKEIFNRIIEECSLNAGQTVFIDDKFENVVGARECGLQGIFLDLKRSEDLLGCFDADGRLGD